MAGRGRGATGAGRALGDRTRRRGASLAVCAGNDDDDDKFIPSSRLLRITDELSNESKLQTKRSRKGVGSSQSLDLNYSGHEPESMNTDTTTGLSSTPLGDESVDRSSRSGRKSEEKSTKNGPLRKFVSCYKTIPNTVPRVHAIVFYIILPLWFLVGLRVLSFNF